MTMILREKLKEAYFHDGRFRGLSKKYDHREYNLTIHWDTAKYPPKEGKQNTCQNIIRDPWFDSITVESPYGKTRILSLDKGVEVASGELISSCCRDIKHAGELMFLLAAKLKFDSLPKKHVRKEAKAGTPIFDNSWLLHTYEVSKLHDKNRTEVCPTIWRGLHQKLKQKELGILDSFSFLAELRQLYHLMIYFGNTGQGRSDASVFAWLNILPENIMFLDEHGIEIEDARLMSLLKAFFEDCLLKPDELNGVYRERGINERLMKFGNKKGESDTRTRGDDFGYRVLAESPGPSAKNDRLSVSLDSTDETIIPRLFLHFFDVHFLREKGYKDNVDFFAHELTLATQIAISASDVILIPAPSYIESPICRNIIDMHKELFPLGRIFLVGDASCIEEFAVNRLPIYSKDSAHYDAYSKISTLSTYPPFSTRKHNTTHDIKLNWSTLLKSKEFVSSLEIQLRSPLPSDFEDTWSKVPDYLEGRALIYDYISPFFGDLASCPPFAFQIKSRLNTLYFNSYTSELDVGIVEDLHYLRSPRAIPCNGRTISYSEFVARLTQNGIYDSFAKSFGLRLIELRDTPLWRECYRYSLNKQYSRPSILLGEFNVFL